MSANDLRLYTHDSTATSNGSQVSPAIQNGRTLTADRKRPYNCNICTSRFGSKMELEEHQNSHTGQKPFECNMCKARFNRRSTLWNHKRIHSDDKPFECNVCRMRFKWKNSLKCHKEMHQRKNEITGYENDPNEKTLTYATAAKKRMMESHTVGGIPTSSANVIHNGGPLITTCLPKKRTTKALSASRSVPANSSANSVFGSCALSAVDGLLHPPLQADGFFNSQKALPIKDSKELDSLLSSTSRFSTIFKDDTALKPNLCDDLTAFNSGNDVFDTKQEMSLFHPNAAYLMIGTHQLQPSVPSFASTLTQNNNSCGDYFHMQNGQADQMGIAQTQQILPMQSQYSVSSQTGMLMNHNVITYQPNMETTSLITPTAADYSMTPTGLEYVLNNYQQTSSSNDIGLDGHESEHIQFAAQQQQNVDTDGSDDGKVVPRASW